MTKRMRMPVGVDDYRKLRQQYYSVDKTYFIRDLIDDHAKVTLITRPRRFGKTLTLSMLRYFFTMDSADENRTLFDGTIVATSGAKYMAHQGSRPVVFFTLKDVKALSWKQCLAKIRHMISRLYDGFPVLAKSEHLSERQRSLFADIISDEASEAALEDSANFLCQCLAAHYGLEAILLIDEYDAPIQAAWEYGFYDEAIVFFRNFLGSALKSNPTLDFAVLTGVLRISKESIFSALNNLKVSSIIQGSFADVFGFTPGEVKKMLTDYGCPEKMDEIRRWYDGYNFSGVEIYNPWSVINYLDSGCKPRAYWVNTAGNPILSGLLKDVDKETKKELFSLLSCDSIDIKIRENFVYGEMAGDKDVIYNILLSAGYLKTIPSVFDADSGYCTAMIPNREVSLVYAYEVLDKLRAVGGDPIPMVKALLTGDAVKFSEELSTYLKNAVSYHDTGGGESFYHGFMIGLLALLIPQQYTVKSNRESGYGRFDVAAFPMKAGRAGVIMELKVTKDKDAMERLAHDALVQIEEKDYESEMREMGILAVWKYGAAFCGKNVAVAGNTTPAKA